MAEGESSQPHRRGLVGSVVGRMAPVVMRQIDTNDLVDAIDVDVVAADLDLDALIERLDVNAIAARLDLDALLERLDVNAIAGRLDMAQLTAGATQDVAVSGLDLVRRQIVRADATVDGLFDRLLRRKPGHRPDAPGQLAEEVSGESAATEPLPGGAERRKPVGEPPPAAQLERRDVSGHYAGPVTRVLAVAGDVAAALTLDTAIASVVFFLFGLQISGDWSPSVAQALGLAILALVFVAWFWLPVALFGRTPAMALLGIAVVRRDGELVAGRRALVRALVLPVSLMVPICFVGLFLGKERRALHDVVSGTAVVYDWGLREAQQPVTVREQLSARVNRRRAEQSTENASASTG